MQDQKHELRRYEKCLMGIMHSPDVMAAVLWICSKLPDQALHILLTHTLDPGLLCICSSISQQLHQAVKATVLDSIAHLLVAVLQDKRYELPTIDALQWLCVTAGPAVLQSGKVVRAVLVGFAGFNRRLAVRAGEVLVKRGLQLTDRLLADAAQQRTRHLDTLVAAPDIEPLMQPPPPQQQQQQPSSTGQFTPLYRLAVAGGADELTAEVNRLLSGDVCADQLADLMYILCNREQQIAPAFKPLLYRFDEETTLWSQQQVALAAGVTEHNDVSTASSYPVCHDSYKMDEGDRQLQLQGPAHAASLYLHLLQTSVQRQHEEYAGLLSMTLRSPHYADALDASAAAQLLHAAVLQYMPCSYNRTRAGDPKVVGIMYALCSLPAAQHITPAVYAVLLQQSMFQLDLFTAVVAMPQAQKLSARAIRDLLLAAAQLEQPHGSAEQLVRLPAVHALSQLEIKSLVLEVLQKLECADEEPYSFHASQLSALQGLVSQLTVSSLMELLQASVEQRLQSALPVIMDIQPAAQLLTEQEGVVPLVVTAIKAGQGIHGICWGLKRLVQGLSTADAVQLFSALVESGDGESVLMSLLTARLADCTDELAKLLQLCVDHARCSSLQLLCEQPAADQINADTILGLCRDILETGVFGRVGPDLGTASESVLTLAGAELIEPSDAAVLFTGALQSGDVQLAVWLTHLLPQLRDHPSTATAVGSSDRLLQLLRSAFSYDCPGAVKLLCGQAVMAQIDAHSRAEILVAAVGYTARYVNEEEGSTWQQPQHVEGVLAQLLPQTLCTRDVLLQLLQACAVHACPQLLRVLVSYSAVDELMPDDVEPLLLQCIPWRKQERAAGRVENFKLLLQLPASQSLSAGALSRLLKTAAAGSRTLSMQLLKLPAVELLPSEAVVAVATACLQGQQRPHSKPGHVPAEQWLIMQLPGYLQLCRPQVEGLLQVAFQGGHRSWVEQLLKHPAAPVDSPLVQLYRASSL